MFVEAWITEGYALVNFMVALGKIQKPIERSKSKKNGEEAQENVLPKRKSQNLKLQVNRSTP